MVDADGRSIEIVTVHSAKGLEWPVVIPINRVSQPRRPEKFVYRRTDETLHWALGSVTPPSLKGALQDEISEKRNEDLRLLYVACTRAMELLVIPAFTWCDDASWAKLLDFRLDQVPELNLKHLPRRGFNAQASVENQQSADLFAAEQTRLETAYRRIRWIRPSDGDPDVVPSSCRHRRARMSRFSRSPPSKEAEPVACSSTSSWKSCRPANWTTAWML